MNDVLNARRCTVRTCIACPRGCRLSIESRGAELTVRGNGCPKGVPYGIQEATAPQRILTTTVRTTFAGFPRLSVRSSAEVPLADIPGLMRLIDAVCVDRMISGGEVVLRDLLPPGVDLVATDEMQLA
jgi:CxxC motif-containing protein